VSFETAARVFSDPYAPVEQDRFENGEERWQAIGIVEGVVVLLVAHAVSGQGDIEVIPIVSARRANRRERRRYEEENGMSRDESKRHTPTAEESLAHWPRATDALIA
jgi:uncharacterized protein